MRAFIVAAALLLAAPSAHAEDARQWFAEAGTAWQAGDYAKAASLYEKIIQSGVVSADLHYNLGTARLRAGQRGAAILAFERALKLEPHDADVAWNLNEAVRGNIDKIVGAREEEPFLERVGARVPVAPVGLAFVACWLVAGAAFILRRFVRRGAGALSTVALMAFVASVALGAMLGAAAWHERYSRYAVCVAPSAAVREGPARGFKAAFEIHEGLKVRVVAEEAQFLRIRLPNGVEGWVAEAEVPKI